MTQSHQDKGFPELEILYFFVFFRIFLKYIDKFFANYFSFFSGSFTPESFLKNVLEELTISN